MPRFDDTQPDDVVEGTDPGYVLTPVDLPGARCTCGYVDLADRMEQHLRIAHPAHRNPVLTCQANPVWDHERWCIRARGHDGDHWTPSFNGGMSWPNTKPRTRAKSRTKSNTRQKGEKR